MEKFMMYKQRAQQQIRIADHMLTMTYPLVKDPKILIAVLENIFLSITNALGSILAYERVFKRIPPFHDTFESKYSMFKAKIVPRYQIDLKWVRFIAEIKELVNEHKNSTTEFVRPGKFVIADDHYRIKTLSEQDLKKYLKNAKELVHDLLLLVSKNDAMFGRR